MAPQGGRIVKERPIIFSAPMVRAILAGAKSQTRRVVKGAPAEWAPVQPQVYSPTVIDRHGYEQPGPTAYGAGNADGECWIRCPYGQPGDRLWVREAWGEPWHHAQPRCFYRASDDGWMGSHPDFDGWRPSIHMCRWASRITLEITSARVERLQAISEADAAAEGVTPKWEPGFSGRLMEALGGFSFRPAASAYADLWESLHGPGSWDANPWVWVVEFKRINQAGNT